jgi:hypothetical protein
MNGTLRRCGAAAGMFSRGPKIQHDDLPLRAFVLRAASG